MLFSLVDFTYSFYSVEALECEQGRLEPFGVVVADRSAYQWSAHSFAADALTGLLALSTDHFTMTVVRNHPAKILRRNV